MDATTTSRGLSHCVYLNYLQSSLAKSEPSLKPSVFTSYGLRIFGGDGPVVVTTTQASPVAVSGSITLLLEFTTIDSLYHKDSFYELTFNFICP